MDAYDTVVQLAAVPVVLAPYSHRVRAALGRARLIHNPDGFRVRMVLGHDLLATITQLVLIPLDRFEEAL